MNKEQQLEIMDTQADKLFQFCINSWLQDIEQYKNSKEEDPIYSKEELIEKTNQSIKLSKDLWKKYVALKERYKHESIEKRYALIKDWYDLNEIMYFELSDHGNHKKFADFYALPISGDEKESKEKSDTERQIISEEIVKRIEYQYSSIK